MLHVYSCKWDGERISRTVQTQVTTIIILTRRMSFYSGKRDWTGFELWIIICPYKTWQFIHFLSCRFVNIFLAIDERDQALMLGKQKPLDESHWCEWLIWRWLGGTRSTHSPFQNFPKSIGLSAKPAGKALLHRDWQSNSSPVWSWGENRRKEEIGEKCLLKIVHINRLESAGGGRGIRHTDKCRMRENDWIESGVRKRLWFIWGLRRLHTPPAPTAASISSAGCCLCDKEYRKSEQF